MQRFLSAFALAIALLASPAFANTVTTERSEASLISEVKTVGAGQKFWVALSLRMQPGWHVYWKNPGDSGIPPTLKWTLPNGFSAGETVFLAPERKETGPLVDYTHSGDAYFLVEITPPPILRDNATAILALDASWLICQDVCIPESAKLSLAIPGGEARDGEKGPNAGLIQDLLTKLPATPGEPLSFTTERGVVRFAMPMPKLPSGVKSATFFPVTDGFIVNAAIQEIEIEADKVSFHLNEAGKTSPNKAEGVVSLFLENGSRQDYNVRLLKNDSAGAALPGAAGGNVSTDGGGKQGLGPAMLFAFLGGLILNLMPCVFPILSLKALAIAKKAATSASHIRIHGVAYTLGVLLSFLGLAFVLILVKQTGQAAGWGYQMQSPPFVVGLAMLLFFVGLNLSGYFELPGIFGNVGGDSAAKDTSFGSFMTGVLAVLVATPCTAPFMAPALGYALTQNIPTIIAVFTSLALGLSAPFLLISFVPALVQKLPRPGIWMLTFKHALAWPMYLSAVWLFWVLTRQAGVDAGGIALLGVVIVSFSIWLWKFNSPGMRFFAVCIGIIAVASTLFMVEPRAKGMTLHNTAEKFSVTRLNQFRAQGRAVFIDATADWCLTCKVNEKVALSSGSIMMEFSERKIVFMVADWTNADDEITKYLASFGRQGVPMYVYYPVSGEPKVLPQLLTEATVLEAIK